jgi:ubiquitin C-terminal hydrolase
MTTVQTTSEGKNHDEEGVFQSTRETCDSVVRIDAYAVPKDSDPLKALSDPPFEELEDSWKTDAGKSYKLMRTKMEVKSAEGCLVFYIQRFADPSSVCRNSVCMPMSTQDSKGNTFNVYSVVCHFGSGLSGHYVTLVRHGGAWYVYDDMDTTKVLGDNKIDDTRAKLYLEHHGALWVYLHTNVHANDRPE